MSLFKKHKSEALPTVPTPAKPSFPKPQKEEKVAINRLKYLAIKYAESSVPDEEIRQEDITDFVYADIESRIKHKELINVQFLGNVASGKSTAAMQYCYEVCSALGVKFGMDNIVGDQVEYLRVISNPSVSNTCHVIDEWNALGETGFNATTEASLFQYYSDVQAQRYIHRVSCSPKTIIDQNADVIFEVLSADKQAKKTHVLVSYRLSSAAGEHIQLIGRASIDVSEILSNPVYKRYREKKFKRMELVIKEGVRDVRELHHASIILAVYDGLRPIAKYQKPNKDIISNYIEKIRREDKEFLSILTSEDLKNKVYGLLSLEYEIERLKAKIAKEPSDDLLKLKEKFSEVRASAIANYSRLVSIREEYMNI